MPTEKPIRYNQPSKNHDKLTFDELLEWLQKLRKSQEGTTLTNISKVEVTNPGAAQRKIILR